MSNLERSERSIRANTEADLVNSLMDFLSPRDGEIITLGQVTKLRARNNHFEVMLVKQRSEGDATLKVIGSQLTTEKRLNNTAEELKIMLRLGKSIIREDERARWTAIRRKILEITREAKSKIKKSS